MRPAAEDFSWGAAWGSLLPVAALFFSTHLTITSLAAEADLPSDAELVEKQRVMEKDLEHQVQNILNKVFGPEQSEVKASVQLSILKQVQKKAGSGMQSKRKEENPLGETKFLLPGVPVPKNVAKEKEPDQIEKQQAEMEKAMSQLNFKINITRRQVVAFYNERLRDKEAEARRAVAAVTDLKDDELKFIPGRFFSSFSSVWEDLVRDPKTLLQAILLLLFSLLLLWLFVPLTGFFHSYIRAMREKGGIEVKMESTAEQEGSETGEGGAGVGGEVGGEIGTQKEGDEEMAKKYVPFEYINDENLKRLLGVFRKEPPQVIALVLSYLKPELVRQIYAELPPDVQTKVAAESGALRQATEEQVRMVDENIRAKIDFLVGGVDNLIRILDEVDYKIRDNILEYLMNHKPQLYEKVRTSILLFDDVLKFSDQAIQPIIRELKTEQLARALKKASPEMLHKFFSNMSQGGGALLKEEMEYGRPVSDEQIEQERQNILNVVKRLESEGKIHVREKKKISVFESEDATSPLVPSLPDEDFIASGLSGPGAGPTAKGAEQDPASHIAYGAQLYSEGRYEEALPYLQYAVQADPSQAQGFQVLGHCYYGLGLTREALECYEAALALSPADAELRQWVGQFKQSVEI